MDDEFTAAPPPPSSADFEWAEKRTADGSATLLVLIDPVHGIRQADVDRIGEWADTLAEVSTSG